MSTGINIAFRFFETSLSAVELTVPGDFHDKTAIPIPSGVYDLRMGSVLGTPCQTCKGNGVVCPGHWGVVRLKTAAIWPHQASSLIKFLNATCPWDRNLKLYPRERVLARLAFELLEHHCISEAQELWNNPIRFAVAGNDHLSDEELSDVGELFAPWFAQANKFSIRTKKPLKKPVDSDDSSSDSESSESENSSSSTSSSSSDSDDDAVNTKKKMKDADDSDLSDDSDSDSDLPKKKETKKIKKNIMDITVEQEKFLIEKIKRIIAEKAAQVKITPEELRKRCFNLPTAAFQASRMNLINEILATVRQRSFCPVDGANLIIPRFKLDDQGGLKVIFMPRGLDMFAHNTEEKQVFFYNRNDSSNDRVVFTNDIFHYLKAIYENEADLLKLIFRVDSADAFARIFIAKEFNVSPNNTRPPEKGEFTPYKADDLSNYIKKLITLNNRVIEVKKTIGTDLNEKNPLYKTLLELTLAIQNLYTELIDGSAKGTWKGIKEDIGRKEGIFRKYFMGKRVNFSARSVITPSLTCDAREIQIPRGIAMKLSYPVSVTEFNCRELMTYVRNGTSVYPGAVSVESHDGKVVDLKELTDLERELIASKLLTHTRCVNRHILDGDYCLFNRQPTLHRPSLMAQRVRVSPIPTEKVFRFHYANCKSFNADFDGDEMNVHFPRNELSKAEMMYLAHSPLQFIDPTRGEPIRGLIQDHIAAGVLLSMKNSFLTREEYLQLIHEALFRFMPADMAIMDLQPCILKPVPRWSGKQVFSAIILNLERAFKCRYNINYDGKSKLKGNMWKPFIEEGDVVIRSGELLTGVMDKNQIGASKKSIVHACYELHGPYFTDAFLSGLSRVLSLYLRNHGFTCSIEDCLLSTKGDEIRKEILSNNTRKVIADSTVFVTEGNTNSENLKSRLDSTYKDPALVKDLDNVVKKVVNKNTELLSNKTIPEEQYRSFPHNFLTLMAESGAKGSRVNVSQIACCLGLQTYGGSRVTPTISGQTLPSFDSFDLRPIAGGYIGGRFLTGLQPQEFFFHCMAGRDGLNDTALKTADSGYLQRCLVKAMEDVTIGYDHTVRDGHGMVIQFAYGGDASDTSKLSYEDLQFYSMNAEALMDKFYRELGLSKENYGNAKALAQEAENYLSPILRCDDRYTLQGGFKDSWESEVRTYLMTNPEGIVSKDVPSRPVCSPDTLMSLKQMQVVNGIAAPGEAVGIIAAQAFGEPSTQMTLNTFHSTGSDVVGVTQGIPRLRQILMGGGVKETVMTIPLINGVGHDIGHKLEVILNPISFSKLVKEQRMVERFSGHNVLITLDFVFDMDVLVNEYYFDRSSFHERCMTLVEEICMGAYGVPESKKVSLNKQLRMLEEIDMQKIVRKCLSTHGLASLDHDWDDIDKMLTPEQVTAADTDFYTDFFTDSVDAKMALKARVSAVTTNRALVSEYGQRILKGRQARQHFLDLLNEDPSIDSDKGVLSITLKVPLAEKRALSLEVANALENTFIRYVPKIMKAQYVPDMKSVLLQGFEKDLVNIYRLEKVLNEKRLRMNNIREILNIYGIEASRQLIFDELDLVFSSYGQDVNKRHISLISDWVTYLGDYQTMSKYGFKYHPSAFSRATFEVATGVLTEAATYGFVDPMKTPSSQLILGNLTSTGTGAFDIGNIISAKNSFAGDNHSIVL